MTRETDVSLTTSYVHSMCVNRLLMPLIQLAERYDIDIDVRLDDHTPVGLWLTVSVEDIQRFHEAFEDKVLLDMWDKQELYDLLMHKPGSPFRGCVHEVASILCERRERNLRLAKVQKNDIKLEQKKVDLNEEF